MKKFLINIVVFIIPILLSLYPIDLFISKSLSKANVYPGNYTAWNDIYNGNANSDLLIFGSSRATHHVDPDIIEDSLNLKTYNFGVNGHGFWLQHLKYVEYLKHNKAPNHIIIGADWFSLEKRSDLYQYNQFLPYMLWNETVKHYTESYEGFRYLDYYVPALRYFGNSTAIERTMSFAFKDTNTIKPYKTRGYRALLDTFNKSEGENLSIRESYTVKIDSQTVALLDKFLNDCMQRNINVYLVYTPEYFNEQHFIVNRNDAVNIYKDLSVKYNLPFLDYSNGDISRDLKYFNSTKHLNVLGAELFTKQLVTDLRRNYIK